MRHVGAQVQPGGRLISRHGSSLRKHGPSFASARFCSANNIANVKIGSAFRSDFGVRYGVEIIDGPMKGLLARALVVIDTDGRVLATSLCPEVTSEPDYAMVKKVLEENPA